MGLLVSDIMLIDPLLDETQQLRDGLSELTYALDAMCDDYEQEAADPSQCPRLTVRSGALAPDADH